MNYYEHHLGDWAAATGHLTWDEDMAYTRLLRAYYHSERPIPENQAYRLTKASTPAQRKAVDAVLQEFFALESDGWHQKRADAEIARFKAAEPERKAKKANEETRLQRHREERARLFKQLTDAGQHAAWNISMNELRELAKRCMPPLPETAPETPATATHTHTHLPDTIPNTVNIEPNGSRPSASPPDQFPPCPQDEIIGLYHSLLPELPAVKLKTESRSKAMRVFWKWVMTSKKSDGQPRAASKDQALTWIASYFERAHSNDFLMGRQQPGRGHENWRADFDFLLTEKGRKHVIEKTAVAA